MHEFFSLSSTARPGVILISGLLCMPLSASQDQALPILGSERSVKVDIAGNGGLSVQVAAAPIASVLDALSVKTGIPIHYHGAPDQPVSMSCHGDSIRPLLRCLLGTDADLVFQYGGRPQGSGKAMEVSSVNVLASTFGVSAGSASESAKPLEPVSENSGRSDHGATERAKALLRSMNPEKRVSGLEMLREAEGIDPDALRSAYRQALTDSNGEVRATALQGLATLDRDNSLPLLQEAMDDADSSVRLAAVDGMEVNDESRPLLEKALKDTDESVRELAGLRLGIIH
jgi:hypothetical protein